MTKEILDWLLHIIVAIAIGLFIVKFVTQITFVKGDSMMDTLQDGNLLLTEKISIRFGSLEFGDIVTIDAEGISPDSPIIKRVIGVEGDLVEVKEGKVYVNGKLIEQDYTNGSETHIVNEEYSKVTVPEGCVYVLGDNRERGASFDSRSFGPIETDKVLGRAVFRLFPFNKIGTLQH